MTSEDIDQWDEFVESRKFEKATSIQGQLDTLAAQMNEIQTDTKRVASIIDQLNGDNAGIEYENNNVDPMAAMGGAPEGMPMDGAMPEDVPPELVEGEDGAAGGIEDVTQPAEGPAADTADNAPLPEGDMADEDVGISDEELDALLNGAPPGAEDMGAPTEDIAVDEVTQGEPAMEEGAAPGDDMVSKIKSMIANTSDPDTLSGLADLLTTALSQAPAQSMEAEPLAEGGEPVMKSADTSDASPDVIEEKFAKDGDGIVETEDCKDAEKAVEVKTDDGPKVATSSEPLAKSADEPEEKDDKPEKKDSKEEPEEKSEEESEVAPEVPAEAEITVVEAEPAEEASPEAEEIAIKVSEEVKNIVDEVLNGEKEDLSETTESFEQTPEPVYADLFDKAVNTGEMPSFQDMFMESRASAAGIDGQRDAWFEKAREPAPAGLKGSTVAEGRPCTSDDTDNADSLFSNVKAQLKSEDSNRSYEKAEECDNMQIEDTETIMESADPAPVAEAPIVKSSMDAGKHIASFQDMMAASQSMGFAKSIDRPDNIATIGGDIRRPELTPITKSADRPPLKIGVGVDMFDSMKADWDDYFRWKNGQKL